MRDAYTEMKCQNARWRCGFREQQRKKSIESSFHAICRNIDNEIRTLGHVKCAKKRY